MDDYQTDINFTKKNPMAKSNYTLNFYLEINNFTLEGFILMNICNLTKVEVHPLFNYYTFLLTSMLKQLLISLKWKCVHCSIILHFY